MFNGGVEQEQKNNKSCQPENRRAFPWKKLLIEIAGCAVLWTAFILAGVFTAPLSFVFTAIGFGLLGIVSFKYSYDWIGEHIDEVGKTKDFIGKAGKLFENVAIGILLVVLFAGLSILTGGVVPLFLVTPIAIMCWAVVLLVTEKNNLARKEDKSNSFYNIICNYFPQLITFLFTAITVCSAIFNLIGGFEGLFGWMDIIIVNNVTYGFAMLWMLAFEVIKFVKIYSECKVEGFTGASKHKIIFAAAKALLMIGVYAAIILAAIAVSNPATLALSPAIIWGIAALLQIGTVVLEKIKEHYIQGPKVEPKIECGTELQERIGASFEVGSHENLAKEPLLLSEEFKESQVSMQRYNFMSPFGVVDEDELSDDEFAHLVAKVLNGQ